MGQEVTRYDVVVPIELHPGLGFTGESARSYGAGRMSFNSEKAFRLREWAASLHYTKLHRYIIVRCNALEKDARAAVAKILSALPSVSLFLDAGIRPTSTEIAVSGWEVDLTLVTLFPAGVMPPTSSSISSGGVLVDIEALSKAFDASFPVRPGSDRAMEVYADIDFEASSTSRVVLIATVLELLATRTRRDDSALTFIDRWSEEATSAKRADLATALDLMREQSITSSIRTLMQDSCARAGLDDEQSTGIVRRTVELYRLRSKIVHGGREASPHEVAEFRAMARIALTGSKERGIFSGVIEGFALDETMRPQVD